MHDAAVSLTFVSCVLLVVGLNFIFFRNYVARGRRPLVPKSWQVTYPTWVPLLIGGAASALACIGFITALVLGLR
jgi:hypothetical protein